MRNWNTRGAIGKALVAIVVVTMAVVAALGIAVILAQLTPHLGGTTSTVTSASGVTLQASINASTLTAGQGLSISVVVFNNLTEMNSLPAGDNWTIQGFPIAVWPPCYFVLPVEFVVLSGDYGIDALKAMAAGSAAGVVVSYVCMEGSSVTHVVFMPKSSYAILHGPGFQGGGSGSDPNQVVGSANLASNFTVNGYWDYPLTYADSQDLQTPVTGGVQFQFPEVGPIAAHSFVPGVYTVAVADEWGQVVILHFTVRGNASVVGPETQYTSSSGLQINLTISSATIRPGDLVYASASLFNTLGENLTLDADFARSNISDWAGHSVYFCGSNVPIQIAIFQGYYTQSNISAAGEPLQLGEPMIVPCPLFFYPIGFTFQPRSDQAVALYNESISGFPTQLPVAVNISLQHEYCYETSSGGGCMAEAGANGFWTQPSGTFGYAVNETFNTFPPGAYTVAAADLWGDIALLHFLV